MTEESKCCRCVAPATYDSPRAFCDEHWARWWGGFDPEFPSEDGSGPSQELYEDALIVQLDAKKAKSDE